MWDLPRPGIEPVSPALAGGFLTTAPPGTSQKDEILLVYYLTLKIFAKFASYSVMYLVCFNRKGFKIAYHQCKVNTPEDVPCLSMALMTPAQGCIHPPTPGVPISCISHFSKHQYGRKYVRCRARRLGFESGLCHFVPVS